MTSRIFLFFCCQPCQGERNVKEKLRIPYEASGKGFSFILLPFNPSSLGCSFDFVPLFLLVTILYQQRTPAIRFVDPKASFAHHCNRAFDVKCAPLVNFLLLPIPIHSLSVSSARRELSPLPGLSFYRLSFSFLSETPLHFRLMSLLSFSCFSFSASLPFFFLSSPFRSPAPQLLCHLSVPVSFFSWGEQHTLRVPGLFPSIFSFHQVRNFLPHFSCLSTLLENKTFGRSQGDTTKCR